MGLISGFVTFIKTGNPLFFKSRCQIWSELIHLNAQSRRAAFWRRTAFACYELFPPISSLSFLRVCIFLFNSSLETDAGLCTTLFRNIRK